MQRIFLLSHMRAFTSLAGHILGSHPQINGYYEMHISYADAAALDRQITVFQENDILKPNSRYLFDKLLHNDYALKLERLHLTNPKILVSLLEPEQTIKSIVDLFVQKAADDPYASPAGAANYYRKRIQALADFCRTAHSPYQYFDAELFQHGPERLLPKLADWLELDSPLSEHYQIFSQTGKARKGDSSVHIHSGKIDRTPVTYPHIALPESLLGEARTVYERCRRDLLNRAADALTLT
jgi:hypothetical protein